MRGGKVAEIMRELAEARAAMVEAHEGEGPSTLVLSPAEWDAIEQGVHDAD